MPKPMYVWSGSAWVSVASEVESLAGFATQSYADNTPGTKLVVPTSVAVGSGSGSIATQGTVTFSGVSSVSLNGCFSTTYDSYVILFRGDGSTSADLNFKFRASGTDRSTAYYGASWLYTFVAGTSTKLSNNATQMTLGTLSATGGFLKLNVSNINNNEHPTLTGQFTADAWAGASTIGGERAVTETNDGFSLIPASGTISGTINVYGYKKG
jgi:hypothetical protein